MSVKIDVTANASGVQTGLNQAQKSVSGFQKRVEGIKGATQSVKGSFERMSAGVQGVFNGLQERWAKFVAAFVAFQGLKGLFDEAGKVSDLSQRFGVTAEEIQRLGQAAEIGGTDLDTLVKSLFKAQVSAVDAAEGNQLLIDAFAALGLTAKEFMGLPIEEKLKRLADGYANNENKAKANVAAMDLLGKSAIDLIPLLASGGEAVGDSMDMISTFSTDTIEKMGEVEDRFKAAFTTLKVWGVEAIGYVLDFIDKLSVGIAGAVAWFQNLKDGIAAADHAQMITFKTGMEDLENRREERREKSNQVNSGQIEQIKAEAQMAKEAEKKANEETLADKNTKTKNSAMAERMARIKALKEEERLKQEADKKRAEEEKRKDDEKNRLDSASSMLKDGEGTLSDLENRSVPAMDTLQRIGGGYANSTNQAGASKQETLLQKQIAIQQAIVDEQKKTIEVIRNSSKTGLNTGGITS